VLGINGTAHSGSDISLNWTRFDLPKVNVSNANIVIKEGTSC